MLGPILFLIFINDIAHCVSDSIIRCFADDNRVSKFIGSKEDVSTLQSDLIKVIQWSDNNNVSLHKDSLSISPISITGTTHSQSYLSFASSFSTGSQTLLCLDQPSNFEILVLQWPLIYLGLITSLILVTDIQELENVQEIFNTKIAGMSELNYWERLKKLSLFSLQRRRERYIILHMWKILSSKTSNELSIEFVFRHRLGNLAKIPLCKRSSSAFHWTAYERSFAVMGPKLWNCIPYNLNSIQNMELFKMRFTGFLMSVPDTPPVRGYTPRNSNSLLCWRKDRGASVSWSGQPRRLY